MVAFNYNISLQGHYKESLLFFNKRDVFLKTLYNWSFETSVCGIPSWPMRTIICKLFDKNLEALLIYVWSD